MSRSLAIFAQRTGLVCAIVSAGILAMFGTQIVVTGLENGATGIIFAVLTLLSVTAAWASVTHRPGWMLIAAFVLFVPAGFYLMLVPSWVRIAGIAQLILLLSAVLLLWNHWRAKSGET